MSKQDESYKEQFFHPIHRSKSPKTGTVEIKSFSDCSTSKISWYYPDIYGEISIFMNSAFDLHYS
jgi:hypothetical protein